LHRLLQVTPEARAEFEAVKAYREGVSTQFRAGTTHSQPPVAPPATLAAHDTVGAVCMDRWGNVAAATSTGGITMKLPGRVGDSPIVGSGCFADNELGGKAFGWAPL
jgi:beta-aspartyl-peptidase (threonine type)